MNLSQFSCFMTLKWEIIVIFVVIVLLKHGVILAHKGTSVDILSQCCHYPHVIHSVVFEFWWIKNVSYRNILTVITFFFLISDFNFSLLLSREIKGKGSRLSCWLTLQKARCSCLCSWKLLCLSLTPAIQKPGSFWMRWKDLEHFQNGSKWQLTADILNASKQPQTTSPNLWM